MRNTDKKLCLFVFGLAWLVSGCGAQSVSPGDIRDATTLADGPDGQPMDAFDAPDVRDAVDVPILADVPPLENPVTRVAVGSEHVCALRQDGSVWCWGLNGNYGALGIGLTPDEVRRPIRVTLPAAALDVYTGNGASCARLSEGLWCWGENGYGSLGDGTTTSRLFPTQIAGTNRVRDVVMASSRTLALQDDGTLLVWAGGPTDTTRSLVPMPVPAPTNVVDVVGAWSTWCALTRTQETWCWGANDTGQFGVPPSEISIARDPMRVPLAPYVSLSMSLGHMCGIDPDGSVWCWGSNYAGQLGDGTRQPFRSMPMRVVGVSDAVEVQTALGQTYVRSRDGTIRRWGGNLSAPSDLTPVLYPYIRDVASMSGSKDRVTICFLLQGGQVACAGTNTFGQLGDGTTMSRDYPALVRWP